VTLWFKKQWLKTNLKRGGLKSNFYRKGREAQRHKQLIFKSSVSLRLCGKNKKATCETPSSVTLWFV
ncbi:MAG TPA: hypothetical protein DCF33_07775, partial [Saprospirales bacterium]|nr:hypothetical protein [Saprospirales bacterium]